ncbi:MAG: 3-methyl-2-oxobutanoate hydroxymethyltransferase [Burkholderiales bacterium]|nr:3-methyl-2-oxobutanoate hydroxymethyltransferase [Burkholderiales bacterium]
MSEMPRKKVTLNYLRQKKANGERITSIGVYDAPMAAIADRVGFDLLVIGNAGPMSLFAHTDPTTVKFEEQLYMTQAVSRVAKYGLIVGHMPYLSYHLSKEDAIRNAGRLVSEGGADAVKCEGNKYTAEYIAEIVRAGIPVMGHIGMQASRRTEQSGFGIKGKTAAEAWEIVENARAFVEAGVFAFILEQVPTELAAYLTRTLPVPVVTLGGGRVSDGIYHISGDVVGYSAFPIPKNRGAYVNVGPLIEDGLRGYRDDCIAGTYPLEENTFHMSAEEHEKFQKLTGESLRAVPGAGR